MLMVPSVNARGTKEGTSQTEKCQNSSGVAMSLSSNTHSEYVQSNGVSKQTRHFTDIC